MIADSLSKKMSKEGIGIIFESLDLVDTVDFKPAPQIEAEISHAPKISNYTLKCDSSVQCICPRLDSRLVTKVAKCRCVGTSVPAQAG